MLAKWGAQGFAIDSPDQHTGSQRIYRSTQEVNVALLGDGSRVRTGAEKEPRAERAMDSRENRLLVFLSLTLPSPPLLPAARGGGEGT